MKCTTYMEYLDNADLSSGFSMREVGEGVEKGILNHLILFLHVFAIILVVIKSAIK